MDSLLDTKIIFWTKKNKVMKFAIFLSVVTSILLGILICVIIDYACQTSFQSLIAAIGIMIIVLLMGIESKIDKLLNKK